MHVAASLKDTYSSVAVAVGVAVDRSMIGTRNLWQVGLRVEGVEAQVVETKTDDRANRAEAKLKMSAYSVS